MKKLLVMAALSLGAHAAFAGFYTGYELKNWSEAIDRIDQGRVQEGDYTTAAKIQGYVTGVTDTMNGYAFCAPGGVTVKQIVAITSKHLTEHPSDWNSNASWLVSAALTSAFPCESSK